MKGEDFARNVMVRENNLVPDYSNDRPGTDKRIYAYAYASTYLGGGRGLSIVVYNHSDKDISTEQLFRECVVIAKNGYRYDRSEVEMQWRRDVLRAGQDATFNISFPGIDLRKADIRMIIFSFGLGETNLYLFPLESKQFTRIKAPFPRKNSDRKPMPPTVSATTKKAPPVSAQKSTASTGSGVAPSKEETKPVIYEDRPWSMDNPDKVLWQHQELPKAPTPPGAVPRASAEILIVDSDHGFVVMNVGRVDGVAPGSEISVLRDARLIAKVAAKQVRDKVSAALILPEWKYKTAIEVGDQIEL